MLNTLGFESFENTFFQVGTLTRTLLFNQFDANSRIGNKMGDLHSCIGKAEAALDFEIKHRLIPVDG